MVVSCLDKLGNSTAVTAQEFAQHRDSRVAHLQQDYLWRGTKLDGQELEIIILGQDREAVVTGESIDVDIIGLSEAKVQNMLRIGKCRCQYMDKAWW